MTQSSAIPELSQLRLFDQVPPSLALSPTQRTRLSALLEALFLDIAESLVTRETGDEQDHR
jgi:hypothetical protein